MAARIESGASILKWEKCNKTLENFKSSHQVEFSVICSKNVAAAIRRLSSKIVHRLFDHKYPTLCMAAFIQANRGTEVQNCAPINGN